MEVTIRPSDVSGSLGAPPSKSMTHRALICSALADGISVIHSPLRSDDTDATRRVLRGLGVEITGCGGTIEVHGGELQPPSSELYCGESGTTLRLMTAVCSIVDGDCKLTGGPSLTRRPVGPLLDGMRQMGVECECVDGHPPVTVSGRGYIRGGDVRIPGDISSQFVSALLLIAPNSEGATIELIAPLESKPYVELTMDAQRKWGVEVEATRDLGTFRVERQSYVPCEMTVEGDWSSAAYTLAAGALAGEVRVRNLSGYSRQADRVVTDILSEMGARAVAVGGGFAIQKTPLSAFEWDLSDSPDLFPIVSAFCSVASGESRLSGLERLRYKESDRLRAVEEGLTRMGIGTRREGDSLIIQGGTPRGTTVDPHGDHRIAMAFAVLGLVAEGETVITDAGCVSKSYPGFWEDLATLGARLEEN